jgi:hypothetical protein
LVAGVLGIWGRVATIEVRLKGPVYTRPEAKAVRGTVLLV